ncbi:FACR075Cp [Eremothecium gossypii FDAG1]|nr:FACR075Cp [Eremothecium gossypii FDAG1]
MGSMTQHMRTAIRLARYALDHGETPVACVFVHTPSDQIIAYGMNDTNRSLTGIAHAEFGAIAQVQELFGEQDASIFKEVTVYVTVEPCVMCASALKQLGIGRVIFGCGNERFGGNGSILAVQRDTSTAPQNRHLAIPGVLRREAIMLLRYFYVRENERAPKPRAKAARKLDRETFPPLQWSQYLSEDEFVGVFGADLVSRFHADADVHADVDWALIDGDHDNIIEELETQRRAFHLHQHKKLKPS